MSNMKAALDFAIPPSIGFVIGGLVGAHKGLALSQLVSRALGNCWADVLTFFIGGNQLSRRKWWSECFVLATRESARNTIGLRYAVIGALCGLPISCARLLLR